jgi:hypothetical protein
MLAMVNPRFADRNAFSGFFKAQLDVITVGFVNLSLITCDVMSGSVQVIC